MFVLPSTLHHSSHKKFLRQRLSRDQEHLSCQFQRPLRFGPVQTHYLKPHILHTLRTGLLLLTEPSATSAAVIPIAVKAVGAAAMVRPGRSHKLVSAAVSMCMSIVTLQQSEACDEQNFRKWRCYCCFCEHFELIFFRE